MLRIDKRNIHFNRTSYLVLRSIFGIGNYASVYICKYIGIHPMYVISEQKLDSEHIIFDSLSILFNKIELFLGLTFKRQSRSNLEILKKIKSYRGIRYFLGLPIHGQRRHTNARTSRNLRYAYSATLNKKRKLKVNSHKK